MNRQAFKLYPPLLTAILALALATNAGAQSTVVIGTGNPDIDVPAVQAAVDHGGEVTLRGEFSFDRAPTVPTALASVGYPSATVLISKAVAISGASDGNTMATIDGGTIPFYVEAPGASVTIRLLRFVRPINEAIFVNAVSGLSVSLCKVEGIVPLPNTNENAAVDINTTGKLPSPSYVGSPQNISGILSITNNDFDMTGGSVNDNVMGVMVFSAGLSPANKVNIDISDNRIRNVTEPAVNLRRIGGKARVAGNVIETGSVSSLKATGPEVIRAANIGSYVIDHNAIVCEWGDRDSKGISVFSQLGAWPMDGAIVVDNDVTMSPPAGTVFATFSAGIEIRGFANSNLVAYNTVHGSARAALALDVFKGGVPSNNMLKLNRTGDFTAAIADVYIDSGVLNTVLFGQEGTVDDMGTDTMVLPF